MTEVTTGPGAKKPQKHEEAACKKLPVTASKAERRDAHMLKMANKARRREAHHQRLRNDKAYKKAVVKHLAASGSQADHAHEREREIARRLRQAGRT